MIVVKRVLLISLLITSLFSCDNKFPDYEKKDKDVYMRLLAFEESSKVFDESRYVNATIEVVGSDGLLYKRYKEDIIDLKNNEFSFLIQYLKEGDSCIFKVSKDKIIAEFKPVRFNKITTDFVDVRIRVHQYYKQLEYLSEKEDKEMLEQVILKKYLEEFEAEFKQGVYVKQITKGKGEGIQKGDIITIGYTGYFVNRLEFDKIYGSTAFTFTYGTSGQVIKGLDIAIKSMRDGEKSKIIIPSQLAF